MIKQTEVKQDIYVEAFTNDVKVLFLRITGRSSLIARGILKFRPRTGLWGLNQVRKFYHTLKYRQHLYLQSKYQTGNIHYTPACNKFLQQAQASSFRQVTTYFKHSQTYKKQINLKKSEV